MTSAAKRWCLRRVATSERKMSLTGPHYDWKKSACDYFIDDSYLPIKPLEKRKITCTYILYSLNFWITGRSISKIRILSLKMQHCMSSLLRLPGQARHAAAADRRGRSMTICRFAVSHFSQFRTFFIFSSIMPYGVSNARIAEKSRSRTFQVLLPDKSCQSDIQTKSEIGWTYEDEFQDNKGLSSEGTAPPNVDRMCLQGNARIFLTVWRNAVRKSGLKPLMKIADTIKREMNLILNYFDVENQMSSGIVEGMNRKVNLCIRKAFGFKCFNSLNVWLLHQIGKLPPLHFAHKF